MNRILLHDARDPRRWVSSDNLTRKVFEDVYNNTGNLVWNYGIAKALHHPENTITYHSDPIPAELADEVNATYTRVVLSFANVFDVYSIWRIQQLTEFVEKLKLPVTICSIGAQADLNNSNRLKSIEADVKRFMRAVVNTGVNVGVRGEFTADYLSSLGFGRHVVPIGCPSFYIQGQALQQPETKPWQPGHKTLFNDTLRTRTPMLECARRVFGSSFAYITQEYVSRDSAIDPVVAPLVAEKKLFSFTRFHDWRDFIQPFALSVTARIHGGITSLHAGVPTLIVITDQRTKELATHIGLPMISGEDLERAKSPDYFLEKHSSIALGRVYPQRLREFLRFLDSNNIKHSLRGDGYGASDHYDESVLRVNRDVVSTTTRVGLVDFGPSHLIYHHLPLYVILLHIRRFFIRVKSSVQRKLRPLMFLKFRTGA
jgi:hypothetical protein